MKFGTMTLTHGTHRRSQVDMMAPRLERASRRVRAQAENQVPESHASMAEARNGKRSKFKLSSSHKKLTQITANLLLLALQIFIFILVIASATRRVNCLKVTVSIPELVKLNDAFWLNCSHDTPPKSLAAFASYVNHQQELARELRFRDIYSISWYKDDTEFYRFEPSARVAGDYAKVGKFWPTSGVQPDKSKSIEGNVYLTKADVMSEGTYRCEIVAELSFETVRKSKHLKVFALPVRGPRIEILDANGRPKNPKEQEISYEVGDKIVLRCNSNPSKPAARLRWYLNDREVLVPNSQATNILADRQAQGSSGRYAANQQQQPPLGYNVQVTPIEYRNHYKGIYSSHSNLSVVLERDDLVNSRISFKCLASMRQEVTVASKQLIMLTPQAGLALDSSQQRAKRSPADQPRHRVQYNQMRQPQVAPYYRKGAQILAEKASRILNESRLMMELNNNNTAALDDPRQQMMYIYEDSDTTLGPSIVDNPGTLGAYLSELAAAASNNNNSGSDRLSNNNNVVGTGPSAVSFNRADNLEYMQVMRERSQQQHRQRSSVPNSGANLGTTSGHRRLYGPSAVVKSPFYLDENDPFRPVINWPPLDSGKLMLLPGGAQTIVAIPSHSGSYQYASGGDANANELRFITPPRGETAASDSSSAFPEAGQESPQTTPENTSRMILDRLIDNLNCTCTEGSLDTKLGWIVNEHSLTSSRDVRLYPTRVSPDHRQTWISIGLQAGQHQAAGGSLASILSQYYKLVEAQARVMNGPNGQLAAALRSRPSSSGTVGVGVGGGGGGGTNSGQQVSPVGNEQLKFMCQAEHSMLLYSSSEMITFDFGGTPPPPLTPSQSSGPTNNNEIDNTNSIVDKLSSSSSSSRATTSPFNIHLAICSNGCEHMILLLLLFCWHCCLSSRYFRAGLR